MVEDKDTKSHVTIGSIGCSYDSNVRKQHINDAIHKTFAMKSSRNSCFSYPEIDKPNSKQKSHASDLSDELQSPQMG